MFFKMATITRLLQPCKSFKILNKFVLFEKLESNSPFCVFTASFAKKVPGVGSGVKSGKVGVGAPTLKKKLEPVTDPEKLTKFLCGGNILKDGTDPELRPKEEYPDWLWNLKLDRKPVDLDELGQDSWEYWKQLHKADRKRKMQELALKYKYHKF